MPTTLHHTAAGPTDAPPLLFLHGFMGSSADWRPLIERLEDRYRCITVDLPGHGRSTHLGEDAYTMAGATEALSQVLNAQGVEAAVVVGYSMGGRTALYYALHAPERCRRLVLESVSPGLPTADERAARRRVDEERAVRLQTQDYEAFLQEWYTQPLFASLARQEGLLEAMIASRRGNDVGELARSLRGMGTGRQPSLWERLPDLHVSTTAVAGALDGKYVEIAERMALRATRIRPVVVPDAGHNVHAERPDVYLDVLTHFLRQP